MGANASPASRAGRIAAGVLGVLLLAAGVVVVVRSEESVRSAVAAARGAPWWMFAALLALPLVNILSVAGAFWVMTGRYGRVGYPEMLALISGGWLLNNLPLRPGLIGRVAYHRLVNGIGVRASVTVLLQVLACAAAALAAMLLVLWMLRERSGSPGEWGVGEIALVAAPAIVGGLAGVSLKWAGVGGDVWRWCLCVACRSIDIVVWAARYWLVFAIIGRPVDAWRSGTIAAVSEAAMLSPVQVGLREWVVGLTVQWAGGGGPSLAEGLLADGVNRGVEVLVGLPIGSAALIWIAGRVRRARSADNPSENRADRGAYRQAERRPGSADADGR